MRSYTSLYIINTYITLLIINYKYKNFKRLSIHVFRFYSVLIKCIYEINNYKQVNIYLIISIKYTFSEKIH